MLILLLPCLFKIVPTDFSIPSGMWSRHQPAKMQPAEGAQNLGFAKLKAPGPSETSAQQRADGEERSRVLASVGSGCCPADDSGQISFERCILQPGTPQQWPTSAMACSVSPSVALHCYDLCPSHLPPSPLPRGGQFLEPFIRAQERNCHLISLLHHSTCPTGCFC